MTKKQPNAKIERIQFPKDSTAEEIVDGIDSVQDEWAKRNPEKAHRLYPKVYDELGNRIKAEK